MFEIENDDFIIFIFSWLFLTNYSIVFRFFCFVYRETVFSSDKKYPNAWTIGKLPAILAGVKLIGETKQSGLPSFCLFSQCLIS